MIITIKNILNYEIRAINYSALFNLTVCILLPILKPIFLKQDQLYFPPFPNFWHILNIENVNSSCCLHGITIQKLCRWYTGIIMLG